MPHLFEQLLAQALERFASDAAPDAFPQRSEATVALLDLERAEDGAVLAENVGQERVEMQAAADHQEPRTIVRGCISSAERQKRKPCPTDIHKVLFIG